MTTITAPSPNVAHRGRDRMHLLDRLQAETTVLICDAFPRRGLKKMGKLQPQISRARAGANSNPVFRLTTWFEQVHASGQSLDGYEQVLTYLQGHLDELRATATVDLDQLSLQEQLEDGAEDHAQLQAKGGTTEAIAQWIRRMDIHIAAQRACRAAARQFLRSRVVGT